MYDWLSPSADVGDQFNVRIFLRPVVIGTSSNVSYCNASARFWTP